jgi:predicted small secreted protein
MRRYRRLFAIFCAFAFLLTACGGAGEEAPGAASPVKRK